MERMTGLAAPRKYATEKYRAVTYGVGSFNIIVMIRPSQWGFSFDSWKYWTYNRKTWIWNEEIIQLEELAGGRWVFAI
jgi:hypothetical protein